MASPRQKFDHKPQVISLRESRRARGDWRPPRDPAAAPVGTDAEAAGMPSAAEQAAAAEHAEMARQARNRDPSGHDRSPMTTGVIVGAIILGVLATVAAILWTRV